MKPDAQFRHITDALVWGGVLISVGAVLLLNSLGVLSWDLWQFLVKFWPIFLIIAGLNVVFGSTKVGSIVVGVATIVMLVGAIVFSVLAGGNTAGTGFNWDWFNPNRANQITTNLQVAADEYSNLSDRNLDASVGSAKLILTDNSDTYFLDVEAKHPKGVGEPELTKELRNSVLELKFRTERTSIFNNGEREYNLKLGQSEVLTNLVLAINSGTGEVNLDEVKIGALAIFVNSGNLGAAFGQNSTPLQKATVQVNSGNADLSFVRSVGVKISYRVNSGALKIDGNEINGRGVFTSDNFSQASKKLELSLEVNSGKAAINFTGDSINES